MSELEQQIWQDIEAEVIEVMRDSINDFLDRECVEETWTN